MSNNPLKSRNDKDHKQIQKILLKILKRVKKDPTPISRTEIKAYAEQFFSIYRSEDFRHIYSDISEIVLNGKLEPDVQEVLLNTLLNILNYAKKDKAFEIEEFSKEEIYNIRLKLLKIYDHIRLDSIRASLIDDLNKIKQEASDDLNKVKKESKRLSKNVEEYHVHSITVLSIFSALVISFSGILSLELNGLGELSSSSIWSITLYLSLASFFLFNIIFLLLYAVSKISNRSIAVNKDYYSKYILCRLLNRYPYVAFFNIVTVLIILISIFLNQ